MKLGLMMACIWGFAVSILLAVDVIDWIDLDKGSHLAWTVGTLLIACVGIPALHDPDLRHPLAMFYLALGVIVLAAVGAMLTYGGAMWALSHLNIGSHR